MPVVPETPERVTTSPLFRPCAVLLSLLSDDGVDELDTDVSGVAGENDECATTPYFTEPSLNDTFVPGGRYVVGLLVVENSQPAMPPHSYVHVSWSYCQPVAVGPRRVTAMLTSLTLPFAVVRSESIVVEFVAAAGM